METSIFSELEEILKDKPETPRCSDEKAYGKCLVWTRDTGWRIER
jgi:hypothetical protein